MSSSSPCPWSQGSQDRPSAWRQKVARWSLPGTDFSGVIHTSRLGLRNCSEEPARKSRGKNPNQESIMLSSLYPGGDTGSGLTPGPGRSGQDHACFEGSSLGLSPPQASSPGCPAPLSHQRSQPPHPEPRGGPALDGGGRLGSVYQKAVIGS